MTVPIFLDSNLIGSDYKNLRFIYWSIDIKDLDLDALCNCEGNSSDLYPINQDLKIHIILNQLVVCGINSGSNNQNYIFSAKDDFDKLFNFKESVPYNPRLVYDYYSLTENYVVIKNCEPLKQILQDYNNIELGTVFRIEASTLVDLVYFRENRYYSTFFPEFIYSQKETETYLSWLSENKI